MALLYVDEHHASLERAEVTDGEVISEGEFVIKSGPNTVRRFDPANDSLPHGIVVHHNGELSDALVEHDEDYVPYGELWQYDGSEGDHLYYQPLAEVDRIKPLTIDDSTDANGNTPPEPSIADATVVGVVDINGETRVVESGYTHDIDGDGADEEFSEAGAGDFVAIGRINHHPQKLRIEDAYDERVPVRLDADIFTPSVN